MKGIFHPDRYYYWEEEPWPPAQEIRNLDPCKACNEGDTTPHVFPANRTACARLAGKEPGYAAVFDQLENPEIRD